MMDGDRMATTTIKCPHCGDEQPTEACRLCREREVPRYWCQVCNRVVLEKRCPLCGLKARKIKDV